MKGKGVVKVCLECVTAEGKVTGKEVVAEFKNEEWSKDFVDAINKKYEKDEWFRVKVEVRQ